MPGHFDSIGFPADDDAAIERYMRQALAEGDQYEVLGAEPGWGGKYVCWDAGGGAQLWLGVNEQGEAKAVDPHFAGRGRARITLERSYDYEQAPPAGGVYAWVAVGTQEETRAGLDLPAFARFYDMACDVDGNADVQVAAFCHGGSVFLDDDDYARHVAAEAKDNPQLAFAVESFLPIGLLSDGELPPATARVSGRILESSRRTNAATGRSFWSMLVRTVGMTVDVVASDEQLDGDASSGAVFAGSCWLSAVPVEGAGTGGMKMEIIA